MPFLFGDDDDLDDSIEDNQQQQQQTPSDGGQQQQQQQQQSAPVIDSAEIAAAVAAQMRSHQQQQPQQMTQEQLQQHFAVWNPDDSFVQELNALSDPDATPAQKQKILHGIRDGLARQSFRAAELLVQQEVARLRQEFAPVQDFAVTQKTRQAFKQLVGEYPGLGEHMELVNTVVQGLTAAGFKPATQKEAFDKIAQTVEGALQKVNPAFSAKGNGGTGGKPQMARMNVSGQFAGGTPGGGSSEPRRRGGLAAFFQS